MKLLPAQWRILGKCVVGGFNVYDNRYITSLLKINLNEVLYIVYLLFSNLVMFR